jgi:hypothetical protein
MVEKYCPVYEVYDEAGGTCGAPWEYSLGEGIHGCVQECGHAGLCKCRCGAEVDWGNP